MNGKPRYDNFLFFTVILTLGLGIALVLPWLANLQGKAAGVQTINNNGNVPDAGAIYHVSKTGNGSTGLDWTNAFTNPQVALNIAISGDEIWVATGVYTPGITEDDSFELVSGVAIYGGFAATETLKSQRDWEANPTILSGDIEGDDTNLNGVVRSYSHIVDDNSTHVIYATGVAADTILDGFTVTAGKADGDWPESAGGGFYCDGYGIGNVCSPTLRNMTFSGNFGDDYAGGIYNYCRDGGTSSPSYINVIFSGNWGYEGGAIYFEASRECVGIPNLRDVVFISNSADRGGAIFTSGSSNNKSRYQLENVLFSGNWAQDDGGAIFHDGESHPVFTNVTMSGNRAQDKGGGVYNSRSSLLVRNSIIWNNQDFSGTGTISSTFYNFNSTITITHSLVEGTGTSGGGWISDTSYVDGDGNIDLDPKFVTPVNPATAPTNTGDLHLQENSPAIDKGNNAFITGITTDLDGRPRIMDGIVDMGAYEYQIPYKYDINLPLALR